MIKGTDFEIEEFLAANPHLCDLLFEAINKIGEYFGVAGNLYFEVMDGTLYGVIATSLSAEEAMKIQARLDNEWWLDALPRAQGKFNIVVEYVK